MMDTSGAEEEAGTMAEMPRNFKNLRACLSCSLVKSFDQVFWSMFDPNYSTNLMNYCCTLCSLWIMDVITVPSWGWMANQTPLRSVQLNILQEQLAWSILQVVGLHDGKESTLLSLDFMRLRWLVSYQKDIKICAEKLECLYARNLVRVVRLL